MRYEKRNEDLYFTIQPRLHFSAHMHHHIELVLVQSGRVRAWVDAKEYTLQAGDALIVFPDQVHEYFDLEQGEHILTIFTPELIPALTPLFEGYLPESAQLPLGDAAPFLASLGRRIYEEHTGNSAQKETVILGYMQALLGELCNRWTFSHTDAVPSGNAKKVINYCRKHYREDISLEILEQELYINRYYISHMFADYLHMGFNEYINSLRIFEACRKLRHETTGITEIAQQVGFGCLRTFNRAFKKKTGTTPSEYRKLEASDIGFPHR